MSDRSGRENHDLAETIEIEPQHGPLAVMVRAETIGRLIFTISLIAGVIALTVMISVVVIALFGRDIPQVLQNWGGIILGFYFGQFIGLVKDYMEVMERRPRDG
jgi:hypothetical protein